MIYYTTSIFGVLYYTNNFFINMNKVNLQFLCFFGVLTFRCMLIAPYTTFDHNYHGSVLL